MVRLAPTAVPLTRRALQRLPANIDPGTGAEFAKADTVKHSAKECARREGDIVVHTNTIESVFLGVPARQHDVYQHCVTPILTVTSPSSSSATTAFPSLVLKMQRAALNCCSSPRQAHHLLTGRLSHAYISKSTRRSSKAK